MAQRIQHYSAFVFNRVTHIIVTVLLQKKGSSVFLHDRASNQLVSYEMHSVWPFYMAIVHTIVGMGRMSYMQYKCLCLINCY